MPSHLFTHYFLTDGIKATAEWRTSLSRSKTFAAFREGVARHYNALSRSADPNEAETEQELIRPVLELLGWADYLPQQGAARNEDIPDHLLSPTPTPSGAPPPNAGRKRVTGTPKWSRRASASVFLSTPATGKKDSGPGRRTARSSDTSRRPRSSRRAAFAGAS